MQLLFHALEIASQSSAHSATCNFDSMHRKLYVIAKVSGGLNCQRNCLLTHLPAEPKGQHLHGGRGGPITCFLQFLIFVLVIAFLDFYSPVYLDDGVTSRDRLTEQYS